MTDLVGFVSQYLQNPRQIGSLTPSSHGLARAMMGAIPLRAIQTVVEYGPGTGALTRRLLPGLHPNAQYYAFEPNPVFQDHLRDRFCRVHVIGDGAERADVHLTHLTGKVDAVFSGLPFSFMAWDSLVQSLQSAHALLRPGGHFRTFIYHHTYYLPKLVRLRELLASAYTDVRTVSVWANFPPARVLQCVK